MYHVVRAACGKKERIGGWEGEGGRVGMGWEGVIHEGREGGRGVPCTWRLGIPSRPVRLVQNEAERGWISRERWEGVYTHTPLLKESHNMHYEGLNSHLTLDLNYYH